MVQTWEAALGKHCETVAAPTTQKQTHEIEYDKWINLAVKLILKKKQLKLNKIPAIKYIFDFSKLEGRIP